MPDLLFSTKNCCLPQGVFLNREYNFLMYCTLPHLKISMLQEKNFHKKYFCRVTLGLQGYGNNLVSYNNAIGLPYRWKIFFQLSWITPGAMINMQDHLCEVSGTHSRSSCPIDYMCSLYVTLGSRGSLTEFLITLLFISNTLERI